MYAARLRNGTAIEYLREEGIEYYGEASLAEWEMPPGGFRPPMKAFTPLERLLTSDRRVVLYFWPPENRVATAVWYIGSERQ